MQIDIFDVYNKLKNDKQYFLLGTIKDAIDEILMYSKRQLIQKNVVYTDISYYSLSRFLKADIELFNKELFNYLNITPNFSLKRIKVTYTFKTMSVDIDKNINDIMNDQSVIMKITPILNSGGYLKQFIEYIEIKIA